MSVEVRPAPIHIAAPPETVYDVLADLGSWGAWSPSFKVRGRNATAGSRVLLVINAAPVGPPLLAPAKLETTDRGVAFVWGGGVPGVLNARHGFSLQADGDGTVLRHWEVFTGLGAAATAPLVGQLTQLYERMNAGLRTHAESLVR